MNDPITSTIKSREPVRIAGRTFVIAETTTIDQDAYVMKRYRASGLSAIVQAFNPETDDLNVLSEKLLWEALDSGAIYEILGGILVEQGQHRWSRTEAANTAALLRGLTEQADKQVVYDRMLDILYDFLVVAAVSKLTSLKSSSRGTEISLPPSRPIELPPNDAPDDATERAVSPVTPSLGDPEE